jgi:hypothetical protein
MQSLYQQGEWHTYPDHDLLSEETKIKVVNWYAAAFKTTRLQCRSPMTAVFEAGMGLHDDSFAFSTLGSVDWFFWPKVEREGQTSFWKTAVMGGETRPELQGSVFDPSYTPGSDQYKQDMFSCIHETHATYLLHHSVFNGDLTDVELPMARRAHVRLGYNFQVTDLAVALTSTEFVTVDITVKQIGVAPFYYPLSLSFSCPGTVKVLDGVETLIELGESRVFSFQGIPVTSDCLQSVSITLESAYAYPGKPIKFAQGVDGTLRLALPLPFDDGPTPAGPPSLSPPDDDEFYEQGTPPPASEMFQWIFNILLNKPEVSDSNGEIGG